MLSEIGSSFWINPKDNNFSFNEISPRLFGIPFSDFAWLSTGRSAIALAIECAESNNKHFSRRVLLPSYTCESVIKPFLDKGYSVEFFSLNERLEPDLSEIKKSIIETNVGIFLFHRYFGFDTIKNIDEIVECCQEHNVTVIEDRTQCLYSDIPLSNADYFIGSMRKWCEIPDGGFITCKQGIIERKPEEKNLEFEQIKLEASYAKYDYIFNGKGDKSTFLRQFTEAEELLEKQENIYCISDSSLAIQGTLNIQELKTSRRKNYRFLVNGLQNIKGIKPLFESFPQEVTPLYLPVIAENREKIRSELREDAIYLPVIWPKADVVNTNSTATEYLYEHLLCIPIDQRYGIDDMQRIIECLGRVNDD